MTENWTLKGEYLESCNCAFLCPCLLGPRNERGGAMAPPTEGFCDVPLVFRIDDGAYGGTDLGGTHAALAVHTPGAMGEGDWTVGLYLDEKASGAQREALEAIFGGRAGGPLGALSVIVGTWRPTRTAAISFEMDGRIRRAAIPGVLDLEVEGVVGRDGVSPSWIDNVRHFVSGRLAAAKTLRGSYTDHGSAWDNAGRNAHYASFEWSGP